MGEKWSDNLGSLSDKMEKLSIVDAPTLHGTTLVETGVTLSKLSASVKRVARTAEFVADAAKCVAMNRWVIVNLRQGQPHIWSRTKSEQKLVLEPLRTEDVMVGLWRQIRKIEMNDADDGGVMNLIKELESEKISVGDGVT